MARTRRTAQKQRVSRQAEHDGKVEKKESKSKKVEVAREGGRKGGMQRERIRGAGVGGRGSERDTQTDRPRREKTDRELQIKRQKR